MKKLTPQEKVITYLERKEKWLQQKTGLKRKFVYEADKKEIRSWSDSDCMYVINEIKVNCGIGAGSCPWCLLLKSPEISFIDSCGKCGYGKRHGICGNTKHSTYSIFTKAFLYNGYHIYPQQADVEKWLKGLR